MVELWKAVPGYAGRYEVSNLGQVRSLPNSRRKTTLILQPSISGRGYRVVNLTTSVDGKHRQRVENIHRLMLLAFVGEPPAGKIYGCHKDDDRLNDVLSNLYWGTPKQNVEDRRRNGKGNVGERNPSVVLSRSQVLSIKQRLINRRHGDLAKIANETGINYSTIRSIAAGKNWSHL